MKNSTAAYSSFIKKKKNEIVILIYLCYIFIIGINLQSPKELYSGLIRIFTAPSILISDYMVIGGVGTALVNGSIVGIIGYLLLIINSVPIKGTSVASIFTMVGFGFFGKSIWNVLPIILGVFIYSKINGQKFRTNIYPALFGTAIAPIVTQVAFGFRWGIGWGCIVGILAGFIMPPLANRLLKAHEGYNLYNMGFTAGFVGLLFLSIFRGFGLNSEIVSIWGTDFNPLLRKIFIPMFLSMIILGMILARHRLKDYFKILKHPGTLVTDFVSIAGFGNTLINMGLVGLIGASYIELVGGSYNGPTVGALLTMMGFGAFGKHPLNIVPIMAGVWIGTLFSIYDAIAPGPILAALFGTALAPISGQFGPIVGLLAGFVHLLIVTNVGYLHGGMNLYNNGFTAGFVATIFIALIEGFKKDK